MKKIIKTISVMILLMLFIHPIYADNAYVIRFYDENKELMSTQHLSYGERIDIPGVKKEGYIYYGFNTKPDGSGEYLKENHAIKSEDYYLIYKQKTYTVSYYAGGKLFHEEKVPHGSQIPQIEGPQKEGYEFLHWSEEGKVTKDMKVRAVYEKTIYTPASKTPNMKEEDKNKDIDEDIIEDDDLVEEEDKDLNIILVEKQEGETTKEESVVNGKNNQEKTSNVSSVKVFLPIIGGIIIISPFFIKKFKK